MTCRIVRPYDDVMQRVSPPADDLSRFLSAVHVQSTVLCRSEFHAPWGFRVTASPRAKFHLVLDGEAELELEDDCEPTRLHSGDVVLLPHGTAHVVKDRPSSRVRRLEQILADHPVDAEGRMTYGGKGARTTIVCGTLETDPLSDGVLKMLPRLLVVDSGSMAMTRWIEPMSRALAEDDVAPPGAGHWLPRSRTSFSLTWFASSWRVAKRKPSRSICRSPTHRSPKPSP